MRVADRAGLAARLAWLREQQLAPASELSPPAAELDGGRRPQGESPGEDRRLAALDPGPLSSFGFRAAGTFTWMRETAGADPLAVTSPFLLTQGERVDPERLVFIDTETTGLSGGAGTIAFLIGLGRVVGDELRVRQYFLADYPGEGELLELVAKELRPNDIPVTYNGASFDLPLLRARFVMNGMRMDLPRGIDLLRATRRLWGRLLPSCSLHAVEESVLEIERSEDVPGFLVPELYFRFLRSGEVGQLSPVFAHHLQDILSLACLFAHIERFAADESEEPLWWAALARGPRERVDRTALAGLLLERGDPRGMALLKALFEEGDERSGRLYGLLLKRGGRHEEARGVWRRLWDEAESSFAALELAKDFEHRLRDLPAALELVEAMLSLPAARGSAAVEGGAELRRRKARLEAKIARRLA